MDQQSDTSDDDEDDDLRSSAFLSNWIFMAHLTDRQANRTL